MVIWPLSSRNKVQRLLLSCASTHTHCSRWGKSKKVTKAALVTKETQSQETRLSATRIAAHAFIAARWDYKNWFSWVTVSPIPPPVSVLPQAAQVYITSRLSQWLNTGRMWMLTNQTSLQYGSICACVWGRERVWDFWWLSRNIQCNKPAGCDLADASVVERKALSSSPPVAACICCLPMLLLRDRGHQHSNFLFRCWETAQPTGIPTEGW